MNKYVLMGPRRSGKTTKAVSEFIKNKNNFLVVINANIKHYVINNIIPRNSLDLMYLNRHIITYKNFEYSLRGYAANNIIFDDYDLCDNTWDIRKMTSIISPKNIYIFASNIINDIDNFNYVKDHKMYNTMIDKPKDDDLDNWFYSFLTDNNLMRYEEFKFGR